MKKLFPIVLILFAACISPQKALMQTWKIEDIVFLDSLNTFTIEQKTTLTNNLKNDIQFSFLADSVYRVKGKEQAVDGKWWFSADKKTLFTTNPQGTIESKIYELKKIKFRFESQGDKNQSFVFICSPVTGTK